MTRRDCLLAAGVAAVWGINFVVSAIILRDLPPFLFTALRFLLVAFPAVLFVRRPQSGWRPTVLVGIFIGCVQFGLMFWAIHLGMPAGLASLLIQFVTIFTLILGVVLLKERPTRVQVIGVLLGLAGLGIIGLGREGSAQLIPFFMMLLAALGWAAANIVVRRSGEQSGLSISVWSALVPILPMLIASYAVDGPREVHEALGRIDLTLVLLFVFASPVASLCGFAVWMNLLKKYPASTVSPWSLWTPPFGMVAGVVLLGELPQPIEWVGAGVVLAGILIAVVGAARPRRVARPAAVPAGVPD